MAKFEIVYKNWIGVCEKVIEAETKDEAIQKFKKEVPSAEILKVIKHMEW